MSDKGYQQKWIQLQEHVQLATSNLEFEVSDAVNHSGNKKIFNIERKLIRVSNTQLLSLPGFNLPTHEFDQHA